LTFNQNLHSSLKIKVIVIQRAIVFSFTKELPSSEDLLLLEGGCNSLNFRKSKHCLQNCSGDQKGPKGSLFQGSFLLLNLSILQKFSGHQKGPRGLV
jgi:hypothetical protein